MGRGWVLYNGTLCALHVIEVPQFEAASSRMTDQTCKRMRGWGQLSHLREVRHLLCLQTRQG